MEHKKVVNFLKVIGSLFMIISVVEIILIISMNFIEFDIDGPIPLSEFIFNPSYISFTGTLLWLFVNISIFVFLIGGFIIFNTARTNKIKSKSLAKLMIIFGMVLLLGAFVKMNYLILLGKTRLTSPIYGTLTFQSVLYRYAASLLPKASWMYSISINCIFIISGVVMTTLAIKWTLLIENPKTQE